MSTCRLVHVLTGRPCSWASTEWSRARYDHGRIAPLVPCQVGWVPTRCHGTTARYGRRSMCPVVPMLGKPSVNGTTTRYDRRHLRPVVPCFVDALPSSLAVKTMIVKPSVNFWILDAPRGRGTTARYDRGPLGPVVPWLVDAPPKPLAIETMVVKPSGDFAPFDMRYHRTVRPQTPASGRTVLSYTAFCSSLCEDLDGHILFGLKN